jgi:PAS domain S-box-containing protein
VCVGGRPSPGGVATVSEGRPGLDRLVDDPLVSDAVRAVEDPYAVFDASARLRLWNDRFAATTGYSEDRLEGIPASQLFTDGAAVTPLLEDSGERGGPGGDGAESRRLTLETADDGSQTVDVRATPLRDDGTRRGTALTLTAPDAEAPDARNAPGSSGGGPRQGEVDTDERGEKTVLGELMADEQLYRIAINAAPASVYALTPDYTVAMVSDEFGRLTGLRTERLVGADLSIVVEEGPVEQAALDRTKAQFDRIIHGERDRVAFEAEISAEDPRVVDTRAAAIECDGEVVGVVVVVEDITDRKQRERDLQAARERLDFALENTNAGVFEWTIGEPEMYWHESLSELLGVDPDVSYRSKRAFRDMIHPEDRYRHVTAQKEAIEGDGRFEIEYRIRHPEKGLRWMVSEGQVEYEDGEPHRIIGIERDVTERKQREEAVRAQRDELETLTGIQGLIHETIGELAAATTRAEIEQAVCDRLVDSRFYEFAWIGRRDAESAELQATASAGAGGDYLEQVTITVDTDDTGMGPGGRAIRHGEVQVVDDVSTDLDERWRETALDHGFEALAAVPLTHGVATHGVLAVYASRSSAFTDREIAAFEVLGEAVAFALSAARNRRLLESENVVELTLQTKDDNLGFVSLSAEYDCRLAVRAPVQTADGKVSYFISVEGTDPEHVLADAKTTDRVETIRTVERDEASAVFELKMRESVFQSLAEMGARGHRAVAEDGVATIYAEVPRDADVRAIVNTLRTRIPDMELKARTERERGDAGLWQGAAQPRATLTDRQEEVLRAAYFSGYYEWPRETDSEELADALGVASTTVLQHLRKGHRSAFAALFDS